MDDELAAFVDREDAVEEIRRQVHGQIRAQFRFYGVAIALVSLVVGAILGATVLRNSTGTTHRALTPPPYWHTFEAQGPVASDYTPQPTPSPSPLSVYVTGAVVHPGVVTVSAGSLLEDALDAAGGAAPDADLESINLAAPVSDNQHVIVPKRVEQAIAGNTSEAGNDGALVNINTASSAELETLPHIGPTMAQRIIDYREANGPFARIEDLQNVAGIGETRYKDIAPLITVGDR